MNTDYLHAAHRQRTDDTHNLAPLTPRIVLGTLMLWMARLLFALFFLNLGVKALLFIIGS